MIKLKTDSYKKMEKLAMGSFLSGLGSDIAKGVGSVGKSLWRGVDKVTKDPLYTQLMQGTSTDALIRGTHDIAGRAGGGLPFKRPGESGVASLSERAKIDRLSDYFQKDIEKEIKGANRFKNLQSFTRKLFCEYKRNSSSIVSPSSSGFQKIMDLFEDNNYYYSQYRDIMSGAGGTSSLGPTKVGKELIGMLNYKFYSWVPSAMEKINSKFGISDARDISDECR